MLDKEEKKAQRFWSIMFKDNTDREYLRNIYAIRLLAQILAWPIGGIGFMVWYYKFDFWPLG